LIQDARMINGESCTTDYTYDEANNLIKMIYPSGRVVTYPRNNLGRITAITTQSHDLAPVVSVVDTITYQAFGPVAGFRYGNGLELILTYDLNGQLSPILSADGDTTIQDLSLDYDAAGNIETIANHLNTAQNQNFFYDALHRVKHAQGQYGTIDYNYDGVGNRLTRDLPATISKFRPS